VEEDQSVAELFKSSETASTPNKPAEKGPADNSEIIRCVLKRQPPISPKTIQLFKILHKAGDWVESSILAPEMKLKETRMVGVLGGLGTRIKNTDPKNKYDISVFLDRERENGKVKRYRLRPEARSVLEQEGMI
jgi:hypothetical protein